MGPHPHWQVAFFFLLSGFILTYSKSLRKHTERCYKQCRDCGAALPRADETAHKMRLCLAKPHPGWRSAQEAHAFLRVKMAGVFGGEASERLRILYGGSLKPANADELLPLADVDGGLIGGASLDVSSFSAIIRAAAVCADGDDS